MKQTQTTQTVARVAAVVLLMALGMVCGACGEPSPLSPTRNATCPDGTSGDGRYCASAAAGAQKQDR